MKTSSNFLLSFSNELFFGVSDWQGNRNPFVDYPELVSSYFGTPRQTLGNGAGGYDCSSQNQPESPASSSASSMSSPPSKDGSCMGIDYGDVAIIGMRSSDPDTVSLLALADLPGGSSIYMTDNAWTGSSLKSNEGILRVSLYFDIVCDSLKWCSSSILIFTARNTGRGHCTRLYFWIQFKFE